MSVTEDNVEMEPVAEHVHIAILLWSDICVVLSIFHKSQGIGLFLFDSSVFYNFKARLLQVQIIQKSKSVNFRQFLKLASFFLYYS